MECRGRKYRKRQWFAGNGVEIQRCDANLKETEISAMLVDNTASHTPYIDCLQLEFSISSPRNV